MDTRGFIPRVIGVGHNNINICIIYWNSIRAYRYTSTDARVLITTREPGLHDIDNNY